MANFPSAVSTNSNLYIAVNGLQTTLAVACTSGDTTLTLTSTTGFPTTGLVTIDNTEIVSYTGVSGATITGCTRGADGTTAASHSIGVTVGLTVVAAHHNLLKDEVIAVETILGTTLTNPATPNVSATSLMARDANGNVKINTIVENFTTTVTAAGTTTLTATSSPLQQFTGTTTQNVVLPSATTLSVGYQISVLNRSTGSVTVKNNGGTALVTITANSQTTFTVTDISTANGVWDASTSSGGSAVVQYQRYIVGTASGTYSGSLTVFDIPFAYTQDGKSMQVFYNGQMLSSTNYSESSSTQVTMGTALVAGAEIVFRTIASGSNATAVTFLREDYIVGTPSGSYTGSLTVFNLTNTYTPGGTNLHAYLDGDLQTKGAGIDYLETSSSIVTFNNSLVSGQKVSFLFAQSAAPAGTVSNGTINQVAFYAATGVTVTGSDALNAGTNGNAILKGTTTNDNAATGKVGEFVSSLITASTAFGSTGTFGDLTSISLTAGDWDVSLGGWFNLNSSTTSLVIFGISLTSGNSFPDANDGDNNLKLPALMSNGTASAFICPWRVSVATTTTVYFKYRADYTVATPTARGRISARRVR